MITYCWYEILGPIFYTNSLKENQLKSRGKDSRDVVKLVQCLVAKQGICSEHKLGRDTLLGQRKGVKRLLEV